MINVASFSVTCCWKSNRAYSCNRTPQKQSVKLVISLTLIRPKTLWLPAECELISVLLTSFRTFIKMVAIVEISTIVDPQNCSPKQKRCTHYNNNESLYCCKRYTQSTCRLRTVQIHPTGWLSGYLMTWYRVYLAYLLIKKLSCKSGISSKHLYVYLLTSLNEERCILST